MALATELSRDVALRIALAARILPDIGVGALLDILQRRIQGDLTEESLQTVTVTDLKTGFGSADGEEDGEDIGIGLPALKEAVRILWGDSDDEPLPEIQDYKEPLPNSIRVAVASNQGLSLNGHFGSCIRFLIYDMNTSERRLVDIRSALEADFSDDRNGFRVDLIKDCQVLYVVSIGGPAAAKVVRSGIYPIKMLEGGEAETIIANLQQVMTRQPPPWLAKLMGHDFEQRIRYHRDTDLEAEDSAT